MAIDALLISDGPAIRVGVLAGSFAIVVLWELLAPRRALENSKTVRWVNNLALAAVNIFLVRVLFPSAVVGVALFADERGVGLLHMFTIAYPLAIILSLLAFDLQMYLTHLMFHAVPALWRVHRVHHADMDFDVTTGVRFHPIQMLLMVLVKVAVILVLGSPVLAVLVFETAFNAVLAFNHANIRIPRAADRVLRWFLVTPDVHRLHHSVDPTETNSNFGFALTWWDRLLGTYRAEPAGGHERMVIGVDQFRTRRDSWFDRLLLQPFRDDIGPYAINRRWDAADTRRKTSALR
jgi:sterol desaturase/sphingolipid hydroxylase (fatty acid hydroxylase superfamily)